MKSDETKRKRLLYFLISLAVGAFIIIFLTELATVIKWNNGTFTYSLDDAYIHLALSENINNGHYGINTKECSAPSSSIIWPVILALFATLDVHVFIPLIANFIISLFILFITIHFIWTIVLVNLESRYIKQFGFIFTLLIIPSFNLIGLCFTGMEHSLQLLLALLVFIGTIEFIQRQKLTWWFLLALMIGPVVRYENLSLSMASLFLIFLNKKYFTAFGFGLLTCTPLVVFSIFLHKLNLDWMPSSIAAKSVSLVGGNSSIIFNIINNVMSRQGAVLLWMLLLLFWPKKYSDYKKTEPWMAFWAALAIIMHIIMGRFGWADRYEVYIFAVTFLTLLLIYKETILRFIIRTKSMVHLTATLLLLGFMCSPYFIQLLFTPIGCNNIYEQHFQMHRFATQYLREPVAINDLGYVAYRNRNYVLDLYGLASNEVQTLRRMADSPEWMNSMVQKNHVKMAMIYDQYFPVLPANWTCLGKLFLSRRPVTADGSVVSFYVVEDQYKPPARSLLQRFSEDLPPGVRLVTF